MMIMEQADAQQLEQIYKEVDSLQQQASKLLQGITPETEAHDLKAFAALHNKCAQLRRQGILLLRKRGHQSTTKQQCTTASADGFWSLATRHCWAVVQGISEALQKSHQD